MVHVITRLTVFPICHEPLDALHIAQWQSYLASYLIDYMPEGSRQSSSKLDNREQAQSHYPNTLVVGLPHRCSVFLGSESAVNDLLRIQLVQWAACNYPMLSRRFHTDSGRGVQKPCRSMLLMICVQSTSLGTCNFCSPISHLHTDRKETTHAATIIVAFLTCTPPTSRNLNPGGQHE